jgi:hypothetical protein
MNMTTSTKATMQWRGLPHHQTAQTGLLWQPVSLENKDLKVQLCRAPVLPLHDTCANALLRTVLMRSNSTL